MKRQKLSIASPPRLSAVMAREAHKAVVIRHTSRGWSRLSVWDTNTDQVEHGQWLHAEVHNSWCDLSPDGTLFLYSAFDNSAYYRYRDTASNGFSPDGYRYSYTAISRPPYFTALALWNNWGGDEGGLFLDNETIYVYHVETHPNHPLTEKIKRVDDDKLTDEELTARRFDAPRHWLMGTTDGFNIGYGPYRFYHDSPDSKHRLERTWGHHPSQKKPKLEVTVQAHVTGETVLIDGNVTWADWDQRGRLACADRGALYILDPDNPNGERTIIADFNGQTFEGIRAPEWARQW